MESALNVKKNKLEKKDKCLSQNILREKKNRIKVKQLTFPATVCTSACNTKSILIQSIFELPNYIGKTESCSLFSLQKYLQTGIEI